MLWIVKIPGKFAIFLLIPLEMMRNRLPPLNIRAIRRGSVRIVGILRFDAILVVNICLVLDRYTVVIFIFWIAILSSVFKRTSFLVVRIRLLLNLGDEIEHLPTQSPFKKLDAFHQAIDSLIQVLNAEHHPDQAQRLHTLLHPTAWTTGSELLLALNDIPSRYSRDLTQAIRACRHFAHHHHRRIQGLK